MKSGFTLLEIIIVIVLLSLFAGLGFNRYSRTIERKGKGAEARMVLGHMRNAAVGYKMESGSYPPNPADIDQLGDFPTACVSTHYYAYSYLPNSPTGIGYANRCTAGGKTPPCSYSYYFSIDFETGIIQYCEQDKVFVWTCYND